MNVVDRFLKYVSFDTQSDESTGVTPSTAKQMVLAKELKKELESIGMLEITLDEHAYLMATLPANTDKKLPVIGFISHMDTSPDMSGENVQPRIVKNYDGSDIVLCTEENMVLSPNDFPELKGHIGEDLIVTNGKTLLGADDKAGIAEIISAVKYLIDHPEIKHGKIRIAFTPDEEIGMGASKFDVALFGCDWAYTMDGGEVGELEYENFNAAVAKITIKGRNVHPGYAKNKMLNAMHIAMKFASMLPPEQRPEHTEGYEGFFHLTAMSGSVEKASLSYIVRDHNKKLFEKRLKSLENIASYLNYQFPGSTNIEIMQQYKNMREIIEPQIHIVDLAFKAMQEAGIEPIVRPIRGGTDGCQLSYKGLPCPNIFAGGLNFHGRYEFIPVQSMEKAVKVIVNIVKSITN